jgi:ankyrin repeat protein
MEIIEFFYSEEFSSAFPNFDISYQNDDGFTGLMILVKNKNINAVKFMLEQKDKKVDINKFNFNESSALTIACEYNINHCNDELIMLLIHHGSDINQTTFKNQNALILSIEKKNSEIVSFLIDNGANFDNIINKEMYIDSILQMGHYEIIDLINKRDKLSPKVDEFKEEVSDKHIRKRGPVNGLFLF